MKNIVAHSLEKLYTEFEKADQLFLDSGMKDMDAYEKGLAHGICTCLTPDPWAGVRQVQMPCAS